MHPAPPRTSAERVRLHITPFNPTLLDKILPPSVQEVASDISFHTLETFPERGFGFVEVPVMEAQKLKKKLNGATLRGSKVRIEDAKPEKKTKRKSDEGVVRDVDPKARKRERKEDGVISGHEIGEGRRVKRGWAEKGEEGRRSSRRRKSQERMERGSDGLEGKKLRFKASLPPNATPVETESKAETKKKTNDKDKESKKGKKKVVVEEFSKKTKAPLTPASIDTPTHGTWTFEDGKGWVDEAGNIVEAAPKSLRQQTAESAGQEDSERRISAIESMEIADDLPVTQKPVDSVSADLEEEEDGEEALPGATTTDPSMNAPTEAEKGKEVHPLEALFKRPATRANPTSSSGKNNNNNNKPRPKPIDTSFSFFSANDNDDDMEVDDDVEVGSSSALHVAIPPQTPHTKRDLEWRSIRSAAPTPDTAAIGRRFSFSGFGAAAAAAAASSGDDDDDEDEDEHHDEFEGSGKMEGVIESTAGSAEGNGDGERGEESAFRKWFYENRGDLNRGWKKRRREEKKVVRQRENRRVGRKVA